MKTPKTTTANRRLAPVPCSVTLAMGCTSEKIDKQLKTQKLRFKADDAAYWQRVADALSLLRIHGYISPKQQHQGIRVSPTRPVLCAALRERGENGTSHDHKNGLPAEERNQAMNTDTPLTDAIVVLPSGYDNNVIYHQNLVKLCRTIESKLTLCRAALGIREYEVIPEQTAQAGSLLVDDGSTRRRVYADGAELEPVCDDPPPVTAEEAIAALQASERARMRERDAMAHELKLITAERDDLRERLNDLLTPPTPPSLP